MWAYVATYEMPNDDPEALERRVRGRLPGQGRQVHRPRQDADAAAAARARPRRARFSRWEKLLVWSHWIWFAFPHGTVLYLLCRHRDRFPRGAAHIYATFDLGLIGYWAVPTAPPVVRRAGGADG